MPLRVIDVAEVVYVASVVGAEIVTASALVPPLGGGVVVVLPRVTVKVSLDVAPDQSVTITVKTVVPLASVMFGTLQFVATAGSPFWPRSLHQEIRRRPWVEVAVPLRVIDDAEVVYVASVVGAEMETASALLPPPPPPAEGGAAP